MTSYSGVLHASRWFHMLAAAEGAQNLGRECWGKELELKFLGGRRWYVYCQMKRDVRCTVNIGV